MLKNSNSGPPELVDKANAIRMAIDDLVEAKGGIPVWTPFKIGDRLYNVVSRTEAVVRRIQSRTHLTLDNDGKVVEMDTVVQVLVTCDEQQFRGIFDISDDFVPRSRPIVNPYIPAADLQNNRQSLEEKQREIMMACLNDINRRISPPDVMGC